jgi:diadenosine tetraphosphate (Ap4A) HIT family hydrolase
MSKPNDCVFCNLSGISIWFEIGTIVVFRDNYPISEGHTLIIPKRHIQSFFELDSNEHEDLFLALKHSRELLLSEFKPDGFNVGINDGVAAGQTVFHLHVHLIPRYLGDIDDPRGGVRWIFPEKARYWS